MKDVLKELGAFAFASRMKRLSDSLKAEVSQVYLEQGIAFNDSWFLVGVMLSRYKKMTVTDMADALGISPPAISQVYGDMVKAGIIEVEPGDLDKRQRILSLTPAGASVVEALDPIWNAFEGCIKNLFDEAGCDALAALTAIEECLEKKSMVDRLREALRPQA
ncbi:MAG: MarR family transcriptional regulator [Candidatus Krumholzibacteria bacterium]|nr:MarR family transcriptional regulator [Candidatus Krumholzibacteria bacterium]